ncbi:MAG: ribosome-associated translation inhibitor RaiA [Patescibacteria group bacterium]
MTINITHRGMELTPAIKQYVEEKIVSLEKYNKTIQHVDVEVGLANHHHHKGDIYQCKVVIQLEGDVMQMERDAEDLYKAIDKVRDHLRVELSERKERDLDREKGESLP